MIAPKRITNVANTRHLHRISPLAANNIFPPINMGGIVNY
jgi:hypothetical protein